MLLCTVKLRGLPYEDDDKYCGAFAAVAMGHKMYTFGGCNMDGSRPPEDELHVSVFSTESLRWMKFPPVKTRTGERPPEVPCDRYGHTAVLIEDIVYVWGGRNMQRNLCNNKLHAFDVGAHK